MHSETYKYFFSREQTVRIWECLKQHYGTIRKNDAFHTMEIECDEFIFRSTWLGNPITVVRKRTCTPQDVERFHARIRFQESLPT